MESFRKARDQLIMPPRHAYDPEYDVPDQLYSMNGATYVKHCPELRSYLEDV